MPMTYRAIKAYHDQKTFKFYEKRSMVSGSLQHHNATNNSGSLNCNIKIECNDV